MKLLCCFVDKSIQIRSVNVNEYANDLGNQLIKTTPDPGHKIIFIVSIYSITNTNPFSAPRLEHCYGTLSLPKATFVAMMDLFKTSRVFLRGWYKSPICIQY